MLSITNYEGTLTEALVCRGKPMVRKNIDGVFELTLDASERDNPHSFNLIAEESIIEAGGFQFRIKQLQRKSRGNVKSVLAQHIFFDNIWRRQEGTNGGHKTLNEFATFALRDTDWTFTSDFNEDGFIDAFGNGNIVKLVNQICEAFECEYEITSNSNIHFSKMLGPDNDFVYQYGDNIVELSKSVNTDNLRTRISAKGKDNLVIRYTSPQAAKWGIRDADDLSDERFSDSEKLMDKARKSLKDQPEISIELDSIELLDKQLGERIWLIYEPWDYEMQTRILEITQVIDEETDEFKTVAVVIGNALPQTLSDELTETQEILNESIKEYRSAITQTDSNIRLEVERIDKSIAAIDIKADNINLSVNNRITNEVAQLNIRADSITAEVSRVERKADSTQTQVSSLSIEVGQISTRVSNVDSRLGTAESSIVQQAHQITQKVSNTDYNGNTIASLINQTSTTITIQASKINLVGAVRVLSDISGDMGTIYAGRIEGGSINVGTDATIGNNLYLGKYGGGSKSVVFGSGSVIQYNGSYMELSSSNVRLNGTSNEMNGQNTIYGSLHVPQTTSVSGLARANSSGIGISYSSSNGTLYVQVNGSTVGSVKLT
ncbi:phage tail protein [Lysinibacillus capsici]|uniref:phage tail protein n=1 Tax=Lysinibacillus capsici TaxID=2115968 RepID=UPI002730D73C|nr:phage tail protein [Lysinibacillus capsici]MDP1392031.1 phage tail protein [Lysinibacillus capsici]MDP1412507.1 phage tail protein [Lysinibacillus capsici]MDP1428861.1 phage tail protein [Lysinibacillus capsici]